MFNASFVPRHSSFNLSRIRGKSVWFIPPPASQSNDASKLSSLESDVGAAAGALVGRIMTSWFLVSSSASYFPGLDFSLYTFLSIRARARRSLHMPLLIHPRWDYCFTLEGTLAFLLHYTRRD